MILDPVIRITDRLTVIVSVEKSEVDVFWYQVQGGLKRRGLTVEKIKCGS